MSWGLVATAGASAIGGIAGGKTSAYQGKRAAQDAYNRLTDGITAAKGTISKGYKEARDITQTQSDKAQAYQDPYVDIGLEAKGYFQELNKPGSISKKYKEYLDVGDPLFDYANKKTADALQKQLSALGRSDSGSAIEADLDRSTGIAYQFSNLADQRLQNEIGLNERLLGKGQRASEISTNLQNNTGNALSNLFSNEAQINANYEAMIGGAGADMASTMGNLDMQQTGQMTQSLTGFINQAGGALSAQPPQQAPGTGQPQQFGNLSNMSLNLTQPTGWPGQQTQPGVPPQLAPQPAAQRTATVVPTNLGYNPYQQQQPWNVSSSVFSNTAGQATNERGGALPW